MKKLLLLSLTLSLSNVEGQQLVGVVAVFRAADGSTTPLVPNLTQLGLRDLYVDQFPSNCTVDGAAHGSQFDCAWATAFHNANAYQLSPTLRASSGYYPKDEESKQPAASNGHGINFIGAGRTTTYIVQRTAVAAPMFSSPSQPGNLLDFDLKDMTLLANNKAPSCADFQDIIGNRFFNLDCLGVIDGSDHMWQFGAPGRNATNVRWDQIYASGIAFSGHFAVLPVTLSSGTVTITVSDAGAGYPSDPAMVHWELLGTQNGTSDHPCANMGTSTGTLSAGGVASFTTTATGCAGTVYAQAYPLGNIKAGFRFYASDSTAVEIYPQGMGLGADVEYGNIRFYGLHPTHVTVGVLVNSNSNFDDTECDTVGRHCFEFHGNFGFNLTGTNAYTALSAPGLPGYHTYAFAAGAGPGTIMGSVNLCRAGLMPGYNEVMTPSGPTSISNGAILNPPPAGTALIANDPNCGTSLGDLYTYPVTSSSTIAASSMRMGQTYTTYIDNRNPDGSHGTLRTDSYFNFAGGFGMPAGQTGYFGGNTFFGTGNQGHIDDKGNATFQSLSTRQAGASGSACTVASYITLTIDGVARKLAVCQ